jgi:hypothetical protein
MCMEHAPKRTRKTSRLERLPRRNIFGCDQEIMGMTAGVSLANKWAERRFIKNPVVKIRWWTLSTVCRKQTTFGDRRRRRR